MGIFYRILYFFLRIYWLIRRPIVVGVRIFMVQDGKLLLVKHSYQDLWFLPGGGVKWGESVEEAARREAREEVGAKLGDLKLFGIYTDVAGGKSDHIVVFTCSSFKLYGNKSGEIEDYRFFSFDELPENISPGQRKRILEYRAGIAWPESENW